MVFIGSLGLYFKCWTEGVIVKESELVLKYMYISKSYFVVCRKHEGMLLQYKLPLHGILQLV